MFAGVFCKDGPDSRQDPPGNRLEDQDCRYGQNNRTEYPRIDSSSGHINTADKIRED